MASSAKKLSLFLLLTLLSSLNTHARDSQFFNKVPSTTNNVVVPDNKEALNNQQQQQQQQPNFLPENENSYGLYGHEYGQNPPSTTTTTTEFKQPDSKYLPKNYNPVAYVTQPEDVNESPAFTEERSYTTNPDNNNNYYNGAQNYYNNQQQEGEGEGEAEEDAEFKTYPTTANNNGNNYYYNGGSSFNSQPQGQSDTEFRSGATFNNGGANAFQPQGMSDTRFMENGKYFYDVGSQKYSSNHPYESLRGARAQNHDFNNRNFNGNNNANEFNAQNSVNPEEFQNEENLP